MSHYFAPMSIALLEQEIPLILDWVGPLLLCRGEVCRVPPRIPGVYLLHAYAPSLGGYAVFYAGRSYDLRRRLLEHLAERSDKASLRAAREVDTPYWSAAPVLDTRLIASVEAGLIRALRPICNEQIPSALPVPANLPPLSFRSGIA